MSRTTSRKNGKPEPQTAVPISEAIPPDPTAFDRNVQLVMRHISSKTIVARGPLFSTIESAQLMECPDGLECHFEMVFVPTRPDLAPSYWRWQEEHGEWLNCRTDEKAREHDRLYPGEIAGSMRD